MLLFLANAVLLSCKQWISQFLNNNFRGYCLSCQRLPAPLGTQITNYEYTMHLCSITALIACTHTGGGCWCVDNYYKWWTVNSPKRIKLASYGIHYHYVIGWCAGGSLGLCDYTGINLVLCSRIYYRNVLYRLLNIIIAYVQNGQFENFGTFRKYTLFGVILFK